MVDIHSHILPAFDDGVRDLDESLRLLAMESSGGTTVIVSTSHVNTVRELRSSADILVRLEALREEVARAGIPISLVQGAELYPSPHVIGAIDDGLPVTYGGHGKHVLIDTPMGPFPMDFDTVLFELMARGVTPILAHPERATVIQQDLGRLNELLDRGVVCQVNSGSVVGKYGETAQKVAKTILARRMAHFLASDAHRPGRQPILRRAVTALTPTLDADYLDLLTVRSGRAIVSGLALESRPVAPPIKGGLLTGFLSLFSR